MSNINDALKMKGRLQIHVNDELVQEVDNLVVTAGKGYVASRMKDTTATACHTWLLDLEVLPLPRVILL